MKSEITKIQTKEPIYPCLFKHKRSGMVVMFTKPTTGMVVMAGEYVVGHYTEGWNIATSDAWEPLPSDVQVTLSND